MAYIKKIWRDYPDTTTPILASDMNNIENGIETLDTGKVNTSDIVDNLTSTSATVPLSANQGKVLNDLITDKYGIPYSPDISEGKIEIVAGVIRQRAADRTKWDFLDNAGHRPIGVTGTYATASGGELTINFAKKYTKVLSFICGPDEVLAQRYNLTTGANVGLDKAIISCGGIIKGAGRIYYNGTTWATDEVTGEGLGATSSFANYNLTVAHSFCPGKNVQLTADTGDGAVLPLIPVFKTATNTGFISNFIKYDGTWNSTPVKAMSFRYSKMYQGTFTVDGTGGWDAIPYENGNIWFFGIFLV